MQKLPLILLWIWIIWTITAILFCLTENCGCPFFQRFSMQNFQRFSLFSNCSNSVNIWLKKCSFFKNRSEFRHEYGSFGQLLLFCFVSQKIVVVHFWKWQEIFCESVKIFCEIIENWNFHRKSCNFRGRDYRTFTENFLA